MLFRENLIYLFEQNIKILHIIGSYPYKLDPHFKCLSFSKSHRKESIKSSILVIIAITTWIQIWHGAGGRFPNGVILENLIYVSAETVFAITIYIYLRRQCRVTELFNMLIVIERRHQTENCKLL